MGSGLDRGEVTGLFAFRSPGHRAPGLWGRWAAWEAKVTQEVKGWVPSLPVGTSLDEELRI